MDLPFIGTTVSTSDSVGDSTGVGTVIHLTKSVGPGSFGVGQVALHLASQQAESGLTASVWTLDDPQTVTKSTQTDRLPVNLIRGFRRSWPTMLGYSREMEQLAKNGKWQTPLTVHQHMIWLMYSRIPAILKAVHGARSVIAPHGALDQWALQKSKFKKAFGKLAYERQNLESADCLQATSEREVQNIRDFGLTNPIALISNGVSQSLLHDRGSASEFRSRFSIDNDKRIMLFISRIAPQKGLPMMLDAMHRLREKLQDWILVIGGSDQEGHEKEVMTRVAELGLDDSVRFVGPLFGQLKQDAFAASDLFVLPSHSEGSPMIVLEALAAGVPVLTTKAAAWDELISAACGWCCEISTDALCESLEAVLALSLPGLRVMGENATQLVAEKYTWSHAVSNTSELYRWLHGRADRPSFVILD